MKQKVLKILIVPSLLFLFYLLYLINLPVPCLFHKLTGWYCPGCGLTRCLASLLSLDFYQAFRYNPLIFIFLPILIPYLLYLYIVFIFDLEDKITKKIPNYIWYILLIIFILYGFLRNLDFFSYLAPTIIK